ncbi:prophage endopeptidase tail family protein [Priestia aryabhattai]|uniref:prophage endopeptidase tail family protein n=1 Tax=Priestia aryabhattai TaxID=412384 RepID=UPI0023B0887D|nr:prophage endopeptidase tail family protein [Priestia aryabhattai]MDE8676449.1 prophage endopeptidase tail family protein [Priestia aryabhattai]
MWNLEKTQKERLTHYSSDLVRKWKVNDLNSISFSVFRNEINKVAFDLLDNEIFIEYDNVSYVIREIDKFERGDTVIATVSAEHEFFWRTMNEEGAYVYETLSDSERSINEYMSYIFNDMSYSFSIISSFDTQQIESFGGDYVLALFNKILTAFECEFEVVGKEVRIYERIGSQTAYPYRSKHNISDITKRGTSNNFSTYIRGVGKEKEETDKLSGVSLPYKSKSGTYYTEPGLNKLATEQEGANFTFEFEGTGFQFYTIFHFLGGKWEFKIDNDQTASFSTFKQVVSSYEWRDVIRGLENSTHTVVATFKGKDPKNDNTTKQTNVDPHNYLLDGNIIKTYTPLVGDERYMAVAEYKSPLAEKFGIRPQAPVQDEDATTEAQLLKTLKGTLNDKIEISYTTTLTDLSKMGGPMPKSKCGDSVPFIVEKLDLLLKDVRIMEMDEYPEIDKSPTIVLGNSRQTYGQVSFNATKAQLDKIYNSRKGRVNPDVLPEATKRATDLLNNSATQLEYPPSGGIIGRNPNDYNAYTIFTSAGIGITTNGGVTYDNAITPLGINTLLLTAGQIKTNNIQIIGKDNLFYWDGSELIAIDPNNPNKFARMRAGEFYTKGGAFIAERPDGYKSIDNGILQYDFSIKGMTPQYASPEVTIAARSCFTQSNEPEDFQAYLFRHQARYLRVNVAMFTDGSGTAYMSVEQSYPQFDGWKRWAMASTTNTVANSEDASSEMLIDLGVPTGGVKLIYLRLWASNGATAYGREVGIWQEG